MSEDDWPLPIRDTLEWFDTAACKGETELFFLVSRHGRETTSAIRNVAAAKAICATCPHTGVNGPCAKWRDSMPDEQRSHGVWAGQAPWELHAPRASGVRKLSGIPKRIIDVMTAGPATVAELAEVLGESPKNVSNAVGSLRARGWVWSPDDKRGGSGRSRRWRLCDPTRCPGCGEWTIGVHCRNSRNKEAHSG